MNGMNGIRILVEVYFVLSQFTRLTDRRTVISLMAKTALHTMQRGKNGAKIEILR